MQGSRREERITPEGSEYENTKRDPASTVLGGGCRDRNGTTPWQLRKKRGVKNEGGNTKKKRLATEETRTNRGGKRLESG